MIRIDVIQDLYFGDNGKGKISYNLSKDKKYTHCLRFNGGSNAGHSVYHNGKKIVTHMVPTGVINNIRSIIGCGCVLNIPKFLNEIKELQNNGIDVSSKNLKVAYNTHIVVPAHLIEDGKDVKIGTTKQGIGPCYRDKYSRVGLRAENFPELKPYLIDLYDEFYQSDKDLYILAEGAQGFYLDIDHGDYPYVTSSSCMVAGVLQNGFPPESIRKVIGCIKAYTTYVGAKQFQPSDEIFKQIQKVGSEYGATTGRPRQCNWNSLKLLKKAILINGVTELIINKMDILQKIGVWKVYDINDKLIDLKNEDNFKTYITLFVQDCGVEKVTFSYSAEFI